MIIIFLLGLLFYSLAVALSYNETVKASWYYFPVGILIGMITNFLWFWIAKQISDKSIIIKYGFYWDTMIVLTYALIPMLFFGVRLSSMTEIGIALIAIGIILTKLG